MGFIDLPNLPQSRVNLCVCGQAQMQIYDFLRSFGINLLISEPNENVDSRIKFHADISVYHAGGKNVILDQTQKKLSQTLIGLGFNVIWAKNRVGGSYPNDCRLNFAAVGRYLIGKSEIADDTLLSIAKENALTPLNVKQGYAKCSICPVSENAIITDDENIFAVCAKAGLDCLLVKKGNVNLDGFDYGFIGGASAKVDNDLILFFGDISTHCDWRQIIDFLKKHDCNAECIPNFPLTDIGGIISLC